LDESVKTSRNISDLNPRVAAKCNAHVAACSLEGIDLLITCTRRDFEEQNRLYAQGRTTPGSIVTNAQAGDSAHNYDLAYDCVPLRNGKPVWGTSGEDGVLWNRIGVLGEQCGLEWAGRWTGRLREMAHFQDLGGKTIAQLKAES
jgi:peptidoglycan L-alanyl-D-glutamate endopeptidase CwlK